MNKYHIVRYGVLLFLVGFLVMAFTGGFSVDTSSQVAFIVIGGFFLGIIFASIYILLALS